MMTFFEAAGLSLWLTCRRSKSCAQVVSADVCRSMQRLIRDLWRSLNQGSDPACNRHTKLTKKEVRRGTIKARGCNCTSLLG